MLNSKLLFFSAVIVVLLGCTEPGIPAYRQVSNMSQCEKQELKEALAASDLVFVGRIRDIDSSWTAPSGVVANCRVIHYDVREVLLGKLDSRMLAVAYSMVGPKEGLLRSSTKDLYRLDPGFYRKDRDFVVGCSKAIAINWKTQPPDPIALLTLDAQFNSLSIAKMIREGAH